MTQPLKLVLMAGEPSGDVLGASLMAALRQESPVPIEFYGVGGPLMESQGLTSFFSLKELSVMMVTEVLTQIPRILRLLKESLRRIKEISPQAVVTIDFPGFNKKLARRLKSTGIPLIHYVAPTVWAWRPGRAKTFSQIFDHVLALFPFEPPYFEAVKLPVTFVGHRIVETPKIPYAPTVPPVITLLPGSRAQEVKVLLPLFQEAVDLLRQDGVPLSVVIPTRPEVRDLVEHITHGWDVPFELVESEEDKAKAYARSQVALAASGTVSLELAWAGLPMVIAYKVGALSAFIARRLVKTPYVCMVNILNDAPIVPELLQERCTPQEMKTALMHLLTNKDARARQQEAMVHAIQAVTPPGGASPSQTAARIILQSLSKYARTTEEGTSVK